MTGYYQDLKSDPDTARAVGWRGDWDQLFRFVAAAEYIDPQQSVVDMGCGHGDLARYLQQRGHSGAYVGVDIFADHAQAAYQAPNVDYRWTDLRTVDVRAQVSVALGTLVGDDPATALTASQLLQSCWAASSEMAVFCLLREDWLVERQWHDPALRGVSEQELREFADSAGAYLYIDPNMLQSDIFAVLSRAPVGPGRSAADRYREVADIASNNRVGALRLAVELGLKSQADAVMARYANDAELRSLYAVLKEKHGDH